MVNMSATHSLEKAMAYMRSSEPLKARRLAQELLESRDPVSREVGYYIFSQLGDSRLLRVVRHELPRIHNTYYRSTCIGSVAYGQWQPDPYSQDVEISCEPGGWFSPSMINGTKYSNNIPTVSESEFPYYAARGLPVIIDGLVRDWPACSKWQRSTFLATHGNIKAIWPGTHEELTFGDFIRLYISDDTEHPKYYFGRGGMTESALNVSSDYLLPKVFSAEEWEPYGESGQYFYLGPARSGTYIHSHSTAANILVFGVKRWFLFPPNCNWLRDVEGTSHYHEYNMTDWAKNVLPTLAIKPLEAIQQSGQMLFVPPGWVHGVVNLTPVIGIAWEMARNPLCEKLLGIAQ